MALNPLSDAFELRILSGLHKGARAALPAGSSVVIGSGSLCDFILRDAGIPERLLKLQQQGGAWMLQWLTDLADADSEAKTEKLIALPRDKAVALLPRKIHKNPDTSASEFPVFAVQLTHMPWPAVLPPLMTSPAAPLEEIPVHERGEQTQVDGNSDGAAKAPTAHFAENNLSGRIEPSFDSISAMGSKHMPASAKTALPSSRAVYRYIVAALVLVFFLLLGYWLFGLQKQSPGLAASNTLAAQVQPRPAPTDTASDRAAITAIVTALNLQSRVRIDTAEYNPRSLLVRAGPLSDEETEALAAALSRLSPRPGLRVVSEFALREAVQEALAKQAAAKGTALTLQQLAVGRFRIQGRLAENKDREALMAALQTEFADMAVFESGLQTSSDIAAAMVEALQKEGIATVKGQWINGKLQLQAQMPKASLPLWEASLLRIAARYQLPFDATLGWMTASESARDTRINAGLPFVLQSIVGGFMPYVTASNGNKIMLGGSYLGWTLLDVSTQRVLFENDKNKQRSEVRR